MKKTFFLLAIAAAVMSCGSNENKPAANNQPAPTQTTDLSQNPDYKKGLELVSKSDCFTCHKVAEKLTGPAYIDVAKKYAGQPGIEDTLANKVIRGGSGNWGQVPMTPHPQLSHEDAVAMVKYVLTLNQQ